MGCWNGTCMISNLPILSGEKVKLVFLHSPYRENKIKSSAYCYPNGIFHPGAYALTAEYDDYGCVENIEEDLNFRLIEAYLKSKYKEIKADGEKLKEFTIYDILKGIERGKLKVLAEGDKERKKLAEGAVEVYSKNGYSSDEVKKKWEDLANMDVSEQWRNPGINFVMIRKDVWDSIIKEHKTEFWKESEFRTHDKDYYQTAQEWVECRFKKYKEAKGLLKSFENPISTGGYDGGTRMFMSGFYSECLLQCDDEQLDYIKTLFTEMIIIDSFLSATRKGWMVVSGAGSQSTEWESYKLLNRIVDNICDEQMKEEDEE